MSKLLPCPFCGGEARLLDHRTDWFAQCRKCNVIVCGDSVKELDYIYDDAKSEAAFAAVDWDKLKQSAVDNWNTRAQGWIDIDSDQPQEDFEVIACCDDDVEMCIYRHNAHGFWYFEKSSNGSEFEATHWMPKPAPHNA